MRRGWRWFGATTAAMLAMASSAAAQRDSLNTAWGHPDLQGVWDFRTITPVERPEELGDQAFLTAEEVANLESDVVDRNRRLLDRPAARASAGGNVDRRADGTPGFYNNLWLDTGLRTVGTRRTSLVIDPLNGRLPALTPVGQDRADRQYPFDSYSDLDAGDPNMVVGRGLLRRAVEIRRGRGTSTDRRAADRPASSLCGDVGAISCTQRESV